MATQQILKPAYLIISEQLFLRNQAVDRLRERLEEQGPMDFNMSQYDAEHADFVEIVDACNTLPFAVPYRLVIVTNIEKASAANMNILVDYVENPSETTVLAVVGEKLAKTAKLYKAIAKQGAVLDRKAPKGRDLPQTVIGLGAQIGLQLNTQATQALINAAGEELDVLQLSLEKVKTYMMPRTKVELADVAAVVAQTAEVRVWDFTNALFDRKVVRALELMQEITLNQAKRPKQRNDLFSLMSLAERSTRECLAARCLIDRGNDAPSALAQELSKQEWQARTIMNQARKFRSEELRYALIDMAATQHAIRTGSNDRIAFERWILKNFS